MSKSIVLIAVIFQIIGVVWNLVYGFQNKTLGRFFDAPNWPIFLGLALLIVVVAQAYNKKEIVIPEIKKPLDPNMPK
jgi:hypothetical protein